MFEYCWEESIEQWVERQREIREEYLERVRRCTSWPWPLDWVCRIFETVRYIIRIIWESVLQLFNVLHCIVCQANYILTGHRLLPPETDMSEVNVPSVQNFNATGYDNTHVISRYSYSDKSYTIRYRINDGVVEYYDDEQRGWKTVRHDPTDPLMVEADALMNETGPSVWSFDNSRQGEAYPAPDFDMIAAGGSRIFVKEVNRDRFYFTTLKHEFMHRELSPGGQFDPAIEPRGMDMATAPPVIMKENAFVPGMYVKLDPEYNQPDPSPLIWWRVETFKHPSTELMANIRMLKEGVLAGAISALILGLVAGGIATLATAGSAGFLIGGLVAFLAYMITSKKYRDILLVSVQPGAWHLIDDRPPFQSGDPPDWLEVYDHSFFGGEYQGRCESRHQESIRIYEVLSIGVGTAHWHVHYQDSQGGEVAVPYPSLLYRTVHDFAGYLDGTCNFYILVRIGVNQGVAGPLRQDFAILTLDEQQYFSERWRLMHPQDFKWAIWRDWSLMGKFIFGVRGLFNLIYRFDRNQFWDPFEDGWFRGVRRITDASRMAVARQTVVVTGKDPDETDVNDNPVDRIYSINFSWHTIDRSWRWRNYPEGCEVIESNDYAKNPQILQNPTCYSQSIQIRDDQTIYMKGEKIIEGVAVRGYWYQRYLPSDSWEVPLAESLELARVKPAACYSHPWYFIKQELFELADSFSCMGIYGPVETRSHYYRVTLQDPTSLPDRYLEDIPWVDVTNKLYCLSQQPPFFLYSPSKFNEKIYLKLLNREPLGLIAVQWDKRDDDLMPLKSMFNAPLVLRSQARINRNNYYLFPDVNVEVTLSDCVRDWTPPVVQRSTLEVDSENRKIRVSFTSRLDRPPRSEVTGQGLSPISNYPCYDPTLWRVRIFIIKNYLEPHCLKTIYINDFTQDGEFNFFFEWHPETEGRNFDETAAYCNELGSLNHATSVSFEDFLGHVSTADVKEFLHN